MTTKYLPKFIFLFFLTLGLPSYGQTTWTGNTNTDWGTATNWNNGIPDSSTDVTIPSGTSNSPVISGNSSTPSETNNLTIESGATLTIPDDKCLTINGNLVNSGTFTLTSGGSLIVTGESNDNITYTRYLATNNWYLVSPPLRGQSYNMDWVRANGIDSTLTSNRVGIAGFQTPNNSWIYAETTGPLSSGTFTRGIGYAVKRKTTPPGGNVSITGTINTNPQVASGVLDSGSGYNLLGNPYTSYINSEAMLVENTARTFSETIWLWNQATASYDTKVSSDTFKIAPGQGFFVKINSQSDDFYIKESYQSHHSDTFQGPIMASPEIYLTLTDDSNTRYTRINYNEGTTTGFDNGYDGEMFGASSNAFAIYTHLVGNEQGEVGNSQGHGYAVQSLPTDNYENMIVPVGINATRGTTITIEATLNNFPEGVNVYLADKQENRVTLLETNTSYSTTLEEDLNGVGRFYIHTTPNALSSGEVLDSIPLSIYSLDSETLRIEGVATGTAYLQLYTMLGKELMQTSFEGTGLNEILLPNHLNPGIYIVKIATATGVTTKKIMIN
jgi:trimeric autotransporter adhesin